MRAEFSFVFFFIEEGKRRPRLNGAKPLRSAQIKLLDQSAMFSLVELVFRVRAFDIDKPMVITESDVPNARLLGEGLKLYPSNIQCMFNKDLIRYMQSLSRKAKIEQSKSSASRVSVTIYYA